MDNELAMFDSLLRGAGVGIALLICAHQASMALQVRAAALGALFSLGASAYLICSAPWFGSLPGVVFVPLVMLCLLNPFLFWLFARSLFDDVFRLSRLEGLVACGFAAIISIRFVGHAIEAHALTQVSDVVLQLAGVALVLHILFSGIAGFGGDLLERRRKLRIYVVVSIGAYMLLVAIAELVLAGAAPPAWITLLNTTGILILVAGIALMITTLSRELYPLSRGPNGDQPKAPQNALMKKAQEAMEAGAFRDETLTLASLAQTIRVPEYQLRRAINQGLGFRNFNAFVNHYRLVEIKAALSDPEKARLPILTLALSAGFGSVAPFNRAFKATFGLTPSQFRAGQKQQDSTLSS